MERKLKEYTPFTKFLKFQSVYNNFQAATTEKLNGFTENFEQIRIKIDQEIKLAVKNATNFLSNELQKSSGKGYVNKDAVYEMIRDKVDKCELQSLMEFKSNKNDTETNMNAVEVLHQQNKNLIMIFLELIMHLIDSEKVRNNYFIFVYRPGMRKRRRSSLILFQSQIGSIILIQEWRLTLIYSLAMMIVLVLLIGQPGWDR